jgi:hypothetical protein
MIDFMVLLVLFMAFIRSLYGFIVLFASWREAQQLPADVDPLLGYETLSEHTALLRGAGEAVNPIAAPLLRFTAVRHPPRLILSSFLMNGALNLGTRTSGVMPA